jgi:hypothetical protein
MSSADDLQAALTSAWEALAASQEAERNLGELIDRASLLLIEAKQEIAETRARAVASEMEVRSLRSVIDAHLGPDRTAQLG